MEDSQLESRHSIPSGLQMLLTDLDFLGQIKRNQKPCVGNRVIVDADTWFGALYRLLKGENKANVVSKVEQTFNQTVDAIKTHEGTDHIKIIINYAARARDGVVNLKETYGSHPEILARLNVQLDLIELQLNRFRHLIKGYQLEQNHILLNEKKDKIQIKEEDFPGLNSNGVDLSGSPSGDKMKIRKNRIKKDM